MKDNKYGDSMVTLNTQRSSGLGTLGAGNFNLLKKVSEIKSTAEKSSEVLRAHIKENKFEEQDRNEQFEREQIDSIKRITTNKLSKIDLLIKTKQNYLDTTFHGNLIKAWETFKKILFGTKTSIEQAEEMKRETGNFLDRQRQDLERGSLVYTRGTESPVIKEVSKLTIPYERIKELCNEFPSIIDPSIGNPNISTKLTNHYNASAIDGLDKAKIHYSELNIKTDHQIRMELLLIKNESSFLNDNKLNRKTREILVGFSEKKFELEMRLEVLMKMAKSKELKEEIRQAVFIVRSVENPKEEQFK
jgi:hypothetical protein